MRLDRFLSNLPRFNRQDARQLISQGRIRLDGQVCRDARAEVREFSQVHLDDEQLQAGKAARYFMLHKPPGVVSATRHPEHRTVLDLLDEPDKDDLHLAGRLDLNTSGLLLISNDGLWTRRLTLPGSQQPKVYRVTTEQPIASGCVAAFGAGLLLANDPVPTLPAVLELLAPCVARLTLHEGRHHQIKRMFAGYHNRVVALHREAIGRLTLEGLEEGHYRTLRAAEIALF